MKRLGNHPTFLESTAILNSLHRPLGDRVGHPEEVRAVPARPLALLRLRVAEGEDALFGPDDVLVREVDGEHVARVVHARLDSVESETHLVSAGHLQEGREGGRTRSKFDSSPNG